jgi:hypothetical protein
VTDRTNAQVETLMCHIEEMWAHLNTLFDEVNASNGWAQGHGPDWIFADLPYHLAYCNRDILIRGLQAGSDLPEELQELVASVEAINDWNARRFAKRPAAQTADQSVAQWRETCDEIRRLTAGMTDVDLERPFWMPLFRGWSKAREGFEFTRAHDFGEFVQLRVHMGRREPAPSADFAHAYLQRMLSSFPMFLNPRAAEGNDFTAVMAFTDPGVGAFTLQVKDGSAYFREGDAPDPDLVITQSVETFVKTLNRMHDPARAIQSGQIRVSDFEALATFGQLFPVG